MTNKCSFLTKTKKKKTKKTNKKNRTIKIQGAKQGA